MSSPLLENRENRKGRERHERNTRLRRNIWQGVRRVLRSAFEITSGSGMDSEFSKLKYVGMYDPYGFGRKIRLINRIIRHKLEHSPRKIAKHLTRYPDGYTYRPGEKVIDIKLPSQE